MDANGPILLLFKATLLLALAFAAVTWKRTSPAARHGVWSVTFTGLLALPLLALVLPGFHVPVPAWRAKVVAAQQHNDLGALSTAAIAPTLQIETVRHSAARDAVTDAGKAADRVPFTTPQLLLALWLTGVAAALLGLARSLLRVRRLAASGHHVDDTAWRESADRIARKLGLDSVPRLVVSNSVSAPMAGHIGRPIVFLPADAADWDADRREVVLIHELTHLVRKDPLRILAARIACALYWFHPLMWIAARRSTADCEQACDESVLALGIRPSTYARVLLGFANHSPSPVLSVVLPIVHRHRLETRVMAILTNPNAQHRSAKSPRRTFLATLAAVAMIAMVAAARPAAIKAANMAEGIAPAPEVKAPETYATLPTLPTLPPAARRPESTTPPLPQVASCWNAFSNERSFSGSSTINGSRIIQRMGRAGRERVAQMTFGDLRVCMITDGYDGSELTEPSNWIGRAERVVLETERDNDVRRLEIDGGRSTFSINGRSASMDDGVGAWRRALLDLLDATWEISIVRGQESSLRGEISSVHGERSSLQGEISSLRGEVSSMQGEISSIRGEESSLRGEISSIRGHESSLRGEISSERGAISSLEGQRSDRYSDRATIDARINRHRDAIRALEDELSRYDTDARVRAVERQIATFDVDRKVAAVERQIREFDVERKVAAVDRELAALNVDREVQRFEREIRDLSVDRRVSESTVRRDAALERLRAILGIR